MTEHDDHVVAWMGAAPEHRGSVVVELLTRRDNVLSRARRLEQSFPMPDVEAHISRLRALAAAYAAAAGALSLPSGVQLRFEETQIPGDGAGVEGASDG